MATIRAHALIDCQPDTLWEVISDAPSISTWFPAITASTGDQQHRTVTLSDGTMLEEEVITNEAALRRFQYQIVGGDVPIESHFGTVDIIEITAGRSLVVYSTDIEPASLADAFRPAIDEAVSALKTFAG